MLPYPVRRAAHRPSEGLLDRRRDRPLQAAQRLPGHAADGLRRLRPPGREQRDQDRRPPARRDRALDRLLPALVPPLGHLDRLDARARDQRPVLLPLDAVDLPEAAGARARLPQGGGGEVVPQGRDGARQRAGDRRALRALRHPGRGAPARAVVLPDHRLRRPPARRPRGDRLARAREDDAAQLDRALGGRRGDLPLRGAGDRLSRCSPPARTRCSAPPSSCSPPSTPTSSASPPARRRRSACTSTSTGRSPSPPRTAAPRSARRPACRSAARSPTPSTASRSRCSSPTTC